MKLGVVLLTLLPLASALGRTQEQPRLLDRVVPLPMALNEDFRFRKTKLYLLTENAPGQGKSSDTGSVQGKGKGGKLSSTAPSSKSTTVQDASIRFERQYRLFGAVTKLDQRERTGNYFDFFWRARRAADLTVRLEYRQEKLHAHVQAQEISYSNARGNHKTEFKVVGDDYFDDGRVTAWRCLLIENGTIVAETHSYMWE
ncbi:MAG TPA: hypothetical protein VMO04_02370 [Chthoniobacterales bacterium]|nr:hypothetical protein [Chthoniobacterales bacterium]